MAQKKSNPPRRQWRKDRSAALAAVLRGIATLRGITLPLTNDVGMLRNRNGLRMDPLVLKALANAAMQYDRDNPKPKN